MRCVISGGGTGGHLFPGMAIAEAFIENEKGNEVLFIGTERGIEAEVLAKKKLPMRTIQARPIKGRSLLSKAKAIWTLPMATLEALSILKDFQPQFVLGVGGYASGPTLLAAFLLGMKRAIHEQNIVPGMTNRILRWFTQQIFVSFEETQEYFPKRKTRVVGMPVRKEIHSCLSRQPDQPAAGREGMKKKRGDRFTLLIFGGSRGAHRINLAMVESLGQLQRVKSSLKFIHQSGREDFDFVSKGYEANGVDALVKPFFEDMAMYYQISDLVICRAGASTIAELAICGKAAILIPYPYAAHNHQYINAKKLVDVGAARMIQDKELNGPLLAQAILRLYDHPSERSGMEEVIQRLSRPRAAQEIVDHCYALVKG
ncbi:MAG: undecaprenyldiphospho-muramoylpentapeptide beta-N-acetylglucosaminyltransferase [Deltaproteobacteria bacterium RBG_13_47_9]|nr:MAG: undecaprenyldiphospho-muramoylpentapeptide beta-N-acetylglucosaminyltransferase [Deltaproteobacteria bacterium RBG_13_47_9]